MSDEHAPTTTAGGQGLLVEGRRGWSGRAGPPRVPVDRRVAGLDRASFVPALVAIGIWVLWAFVVPHLDSAVEHDEQVRAGDRLALTEDLAVTPPTGWSLLSGFTTADQPASGPSGSVSVSNGAVTVQVSADDFSGTATELLAQVERVATATGGNASGVSSGRSTVDIPSGLTGVSETFTRPGGEGRLVAFVDDGTGIVVQVSGAPDRLAVAAHDVQHMIRSIGAWKPTSSESEGES